MDAVALLKQLIACRSVTPADGGSLDLLADYLTAAGFELVRLPAGDVDNLLAYKGKTLRLLFAGHVDVVRPGDLAQWNSDPFCAVEKEGKLFGRGAADMKSGVAAMAAAAVRQPAEGLGLFLTSDEEGQAIHGTRHFTEWWQQQKKEQIEYTVVTEPTCEQQFGDAIKVGRRGSLTCRLRIVGRQEHAAFAHRADNPAHRLPAVLHQLVTHWQGNVQRQQDGEMVTTFQIVELAGGVGAHNVTPPDVRAVFNFRYADPDTADSLQEQTVALLEEAAPGRWYAEWEHAAEPYRLAADSRLVNTLHSAIQEHTGVSAKPTTNGGASDGRFLRHICRELAEFGVCNTSIHAPNEHVVIEDVRQLTAVYETVIKKLL